MTNHSCCKKPVNIRVCFDINDIYIVGNILYGDQLLIYD